MLASSCSPLEKAGYHVIELIDQCLHRLLSLVTHIGNAERGTFDFTVTTIDEHIVLSSQRFNKCWDIETAACVINSRKRFGLETHGGEILESMLSHPGVDHGVEFCVAREPSLKPFLSDRIYLLFQRIEQ